MLRPGLHFHNGCPITPADMDVIRRWTPLSLLLAMEGVVEGQTELLRDAWELAGRPPIVLRRYYTPRKGGPVVWSTHALETVALAQRCLQVGIPLAKLMLKPFNEPNMPHWAQWEGFGDSEEDMKRYNEALLLFIETAKRELPGIRIGGPHLTVGNRDVRFPNDPEAVYYYHGADGRFESSPCHEALSALDVHFVHTYGMAPGQYADRAHGLRFLEYEKYLQGKDIYVVEGCYGVNSGQAPDQNTVRGQETVAYLRLLGEKYPQVKGVALWIGGDPGAGWFAFCHSNGPNPESHRPVVYAVEAACKAEGGDSGSFETSPTGPTQDLAVYPQPEPDTEKEAEMDTEPYKLLTAFATHGITDVVDLRSEIESFSNMPELEKLWRPFSMLRLVVLHHSGSELAAQTPVSIARYHVAKGGFTIPYAPQRVGVGRTDARLHRQVSRGQGWVHYPLPLLRGVRRPAVLHRAAVLATASLGQGLHQRRRCGRMRPGQLRDAAAHGQATGHAEASHLARAPRVRGRRLGSVPGSVRHPARAAGEDVVPGGEPGGRLDLQGAVVLRRSSGCALSNNPGW